MSKIIFNHKQYQPYNKQKFIMTDEYESVRKALKLL